MDDLTFQLFHYMFYSITQKSKLVQFWTNHVFMVQLPKNGLLLFTTKITNKCSDVQPTFTTYFNTFNN